MVRYRKRYFHWFTRIEIMSAVIAIAVALTLYIGLSSKGQVLLESQTEKLARSLTSLAAFNAANYIEAHQNDKLKQLVNALVKENFIFDATIYNHQGIPLAESYNALPLRQLLPMSGNPVTPVQGMGRRPYVAPIYNHDGETLGYLRITLEETSLLSTATRYIHSAEFALQIMLLMSLWVGFISARQLSRKRRRLIRIAHRRRAMKIRQRLEQRR
ncbi:MAG: hypothetical protein CENE_02463 [Candidatus Celerinatantimonas neptuna]|nr:MAG: hypothetical protein CENE_02463 [Candidatus Celerinatantimonas neptuna]